MKRGQPLPYTRAGWPRSCLSRKANPQTLFKDAKKTASVCCKAVAAKNLYLELSKVRGSAVA